jgi:glycosyltransferase involved in cell wall biosynthesis
MLALEAVAFAKPVIAANHGGLIEIVRDRETSFLIDPQNEIDFASKIRELFDDENLRKKYGHEGPLRYARYFTLET